MKQYICPHGERIVGSSDTVSVTASIEDFNDDGTPNFEGGSEVWWDTQTSTKRDGKILYQCDGGEDHTLDECELKDENDLDNDQLPQLTIHYEHHGCKVDPDVEWWDTWSSAVDGTCPACGTEDIVPVRWE